MKTNIYWLLFGDDPQGLQTLADFNKKKYGQKLDVPQEPDAELVYDPFAGFDTEQADIMMRQKPRHLKRVK